MIYLRLEQILGHLIVALCVCSKAYSLVYATHQRSFLENTTKNINLNNYHGTHYCAFCTTCFLYVHFHLQDD